MTSAPPKLILVKHIWAASLWFLAVALTLVGTIILLAGDDLALRVGLAFYVHATLAMAGAVVVTIRNHVEKMYGMMRDAYELGRRHGGGTRVLSD